MSELKPDYEKFAREICQFAFEGCDASGGEIQEIGMKYGVLTAEPFSLEKHVDVVNGEDFEEGDTIYCFAQSRAVPDVAELVRYSVPDRYDKVMPDGDYVLHSQAAEIIVAKDTRIKELHDAGHESFKTDIGWQQRAEAAEGELITIANHLDCEADIDSILHTVREIEADKDIYKERDLSAEAKLAQYEAQEPVAYRYRCTNVKGELLPDWYYKEEASALGLPEEPLYASPIASDADLKAENERLREALTRISSPTQTAGLLWWQVEARAALNVETSHDKG